LSAILPPQKQNREEALFEGALAVHNRRLKLEATSRMDADADH
tara:strand:- start:1463 stop:1591 length:129 start_codon:yes stop_codon:yes gene_type:complete